MYQIMMLSLWTVITLFYSLTNAQQPDPGNAVEFPPSFGIAGGLLSGMLGFVEMFDPSLLPSPPGFESTNSPSPLPSSTSDGQVPISSTGVVDPISPLNSNNIFINDAGGNVVTTHTEVTTTLPPSRRSPPTFELSTPVGVTQKPKPRDPFFIDMNSLQRNPSTGPTGAESSQSDRMNATTKDVKSEGLASGTGANIGSGLSGSVDPLIALFGHLTSQRRDSLVIASVNAATTKAATTATTTKAATTTTTTKRPVLPTAPVSNQEILQMLNTFSNQRVVLGKSQGKAHNGNPNSGNRGQGQGQGRGLGLGR